MSDTTGSTPGDYGNYTWKEVMKAVTGEDPDDPGQDGSTISDPRTLQNAANAFWYTEQVLQDAAKNIGEQAEALAGPNGPWQGASAQGLYRAMQTLFTQTKTMAGTLSGGITGDDNVPQQLANDAHRLQEAMSKLNDIDCFYANEASRIDPNSVMDNGRVAVSTVSGVVDKLNRDMRQVLVALQGRYLITIGAVRYAEPPTDVTGTSQQVPAVGTYPLAGQTVRPTNRVMPTDPAFESLVGPQGGGMPSSAGPYGGLVSGGTTGYLAPSPDVPAQVSSPFLVPMGQQAGPYDAYAQADSSSFLVPMGQHAGPYDAYAQAAEPRLIESSGGTPTQFEPVQPRHPEVTPISQSGEFVTDTSGAIPGGSLSESEVSGLPGF